MTIDVTDHVSFEVILGYDDELDGNLNHNLANTDQRAKFPCQRVLSTPSRLGG